MEGNRYRTILVAGSVGVDEVSQCFGRNADGDRGSDAIGQEVGLAPGDDGDERSVWIHDWPAAVPLLEWDRGGELPDCGCGFEGSLLGHADRLSGGGIAGDVAAVGKEGGSFVRRIV